MTPADDSPSQATAPDLPFDPLDLDLQLCFSLYSASNLLTRLYRPALEPLGLTYLQYLAMLALWANRPQSVGQLGERLNLDSSTLTPLFKRLEAQGLVTRRRDPEDERRRMIDLTPAGVALREKALEVPACVFRQLPMPFEQMVALKRQLDSLVEGLRGD